LFIVLVTYVHFNQSISTKGKIVSADILPQKAK